MIKKVTQSRNANESGFNVIEDVLNTLRFKGSIFFNSKLSAPWGMSLAKSSHPRFHISLEGSFLIGTGGQNPADVQVDHMQIVLLPHGNMHWIADQADRELVESEKASAACELGKPLFQSGQTTHRLLCGLVHFDNQLLHPILDALPDVIHFTALKDDDPAWLTAMVIEKEMQRSSTGLEPVIDRLTEALFLQLLFKYIQENELTQGLFAGINNPRIHKVLNLMHQQPEYAWTLDTLGDKVGMSRATLARHFKEIVGMPVMAYLMQWRMMQAHQMVEYASYSIDQIAEAVGFASARSLSKAFFRVYGYTPGDFRSKNR